VPNGDDKQQRPAPAITQNQTISIGLGVVLLAGLVAVLERMSTIREAVAVRTERGEALERRVERLEEEVRELRRGD
jgi:type II secretory pathway component PulJ